MTKVKLEWMMIGEWMQWMCAKGYYQFMCNPTFMGVLEINMMIRAIQSNQLGVLMVVHLILCWHTGVIIKNALFFCPLKHLMVPSQLTNKRWRYVVEVWTANQKSLGILYMTFERKKNSSSIVIFKHLNIMYSLVLQFLILPQNESNGQFYRWDF